MEGLKAIPGLDGYAVTKEGDVYTDIKYRGRGADTQKYRSGQWRKLRTPPGSNGYRSVDIWRLNGARKKLYVHHLVLLTFIGPRPEGMECRHLDGNEANCRLDNLVWGTKKENSADQVVHGTIPRGERHGVSRLTREQVLEIRSLPHGKGVCKLAAQKYKISVGYVYELRARKKWAWIS